jgi:hypothetical protein
MNGKFAITVTNFQRDNNVTTKVHRGAFGNFGTSQAPEGDITGSFKVSIPKTGFEFKWKEEFGRPGGGSIQVQLPNPLGFTGVKLSADSLGVDQAAGNTEQTIKWTAEHEEEL